MKKEKKAILFLLSALAMSPTLKAQNGDTTTQLKPVIVTANRYETNVAETPKSVTVITSEQLQNSVYQNVGELLTNTEGMYVVGAYQNPGMNQSIFTRGTNSNQMVIMIDGVRITDPSSNSNAADLSEISLTNIDRIEIVRGAQSTLFGSSAIGGVINIITKKNGKTGVTANAGISTGIFGEGGTNTILNGGLTYTHKSGFYINGSGFYNGVSGIDATLDTVTDPSVFKNRDADDFSKMDFSVKTGFRTKKWDAFIGFKSAKQFTDVDAAAYTDDENYTLEFSRLLFNNSLYYKINDNFKIGLVGGANKMQRDIVNDSSMIGFGIYDNSYYEAQYFGSSLNEDLLFDYKHKYFHILGGAGYYVEKMNTNSYYTNTAFAYEAKTDNDSLDLNISTSNAFLQLQLDGKNFNEKLKAFGLIFGGRYNSNSAFGDVFTFEISPSIKTSENAILFANYSTGFNNPSLYQLYSPESNYLSLITRGNDALQAETSKSFEIGYRHNFGKNNWISFSWFNNKIENAIEYVYLWDKNIGLDTLGNDWMRDDYRGDTYINVGDMSINGIEVGIFAELNDKLYIEANATLLNGRLEYDPANINLEHTDSNHVQIYSNGIFLTEKSSSNGLARRPNTARFTIGYSPCKNFTISSTIRMASARGDVYYDWQLGPYGALNTSIVNEYTLWDMGLIYNFKKYFSVKLKAENILDKKFSEINGFATRGRGIYLGLNFII